MRFMKFVLFVLISFQLFNFPETFAASKCSSCFRKAKDRAEIKFQPILGEEVSPSYFQKVLNFITRRNSSTENAQCELPEVNPNIAITTPIAAGGNHLIVLNRNGQVTSFGLNDNGQGKPRRSTYTAIAAGDDFSCGLTDNGWVEYWGNTQKWNFHHSTLPTLQGKIKKIATGPNRFCVISGGNGSSRSYVQCMGLEGKWDRIALPKEISDERNPVDVAVGLEHTCILNDAGEIQCWIRNHDTAGLTDAASVKTIPGKFKSVACGDDFTCGLDAGGSLNCIGVTALFENYAQDENGRSFFNRTTIAHPGPFTQISAYGNEVCALDLQKNAVCFGKNVRNQEGPFTYITTGRGFACGLQSNGTFYCWGNMNATPELQSIARKILPTSAKDRNQ